MSHADEVQVTFGRQVAISVLQRFYQAAHRDGLMDSCPGCYHNDDHAAALKELGDACVAVEELFGLRQVQDEIGASK